MRRSSRAARLGAASSGRRVATEAVVHLAAIMANLASLAHALSVIAIAEGIESESSRSGSGARLRPCAGLPVRVPDVGRRSRPPAVGRRRDLRRERLSYRGTTTRRPDRLVTSPTRQQDPRAGLRTPQLCDCKSSAPRFAWPPPRCVPGAARWRPPGARSPRRRRGQGDERLPGPPRPQADEENAEAASTRKKASADRRKKSRPSADILPLATRGGESIARRVITRRSVQILPRYRKALGFFFGHVNR